MSIQPSPDYPTYWQLNGEPVLLIGGSVEDNLYQIPNLEEHLDTIAACGGNYVRCSMSTRDEGNIWPFRQDPETGLYDLNQADGECWERFDRFIELTAARGIVVQIEVFDRFDYARAEWQQNPFNPKNNINYTVEESGLETEYKAHPGARENAFFRTVPALEDNAVVRPYQHKFIERMLSTTLKHNHVLYCISNETNESEEWGKYWANVIKEAAAAAGTTVCMTEMWDARDLMDEQHQRTWGHPELYDFIDISQVNHNVHQHHWDQLMAFRQTILDTGILRPMNSVKIYGANSGYYGTTRDGQERFWRNILGGLASSRFHRPTSGLGLSEIAQANIRSARMFEQKLNLFTCQPEAARIHSRAANEAFITGDPGRAYGLFFPDGGNIIFDAPVEAPGTSVLVHWLDIRASQWLEPTTMHLDENGDLRIVTPREEGYWACVIEIQ